MKKKTSYFIIGAFFAFCIILFIIGWLYDLQISRAVCTLGLGNYYSDDYFLRFFETFGEMPIYMLSTFALFVLYFVVKLQFRNMRKLWYTTLMISIMIIAYALNCFAMSKIIGYMSEHFNLVEKNIGLLPIVASFVGGAVFTLAWLFFVSTFEYKTLRSLAIWSLIVCFTALSSQLVVQLTKLILARPRFRYLAMIANYDDFTAWYQPFGINKGNAIADALRITRDAFRSFPSGHTSSAAMLLSLSILPLFFDNLRKPIIIASLIVIPLALTFLVAYARIAIGAHFLTDVISAILITAFALLIGTYIFIKKLSYKSINS